MKCPHCQVEIQEKFNLQYIGEDPAADWFTKIMRCPNPECNRFILQVAYGQKNIHTEPVILNEKNYFAIPFDPYQKYESLVNADFYQDYLEAKSIQSISPKASILLAKDCLKKLLKKQIYSQKDNFKDLLNDIFEQKNYPQFLTGMTEAILLMDSDTDKNFAINLITYIEGLLDFYYTLPNKMKIK